MDCSPQQKPRVSIWCWLYLVSPENRESEMWGRKAAIIINRKKSLKGETLAPGKRKTESTGWDEIERSWTTRTETQCLLGKWPLGFSSVCPSLSNDNTLTEQNAAHKVLTSSIWLRCSKIYWLTNGSGCHCTLCSIVCPTYAPNLNVPSPGQSRQAL